MRRVVFIGLRAATLAVLLLMLQGCYCYSCKPYAAPAGAPKPTAIEEFPAQGKPQVDLALALSGGGSRSAFYTIGVLKGLYDKGYLKDIDVFSAVSGGGYALYWLLTQNQTNYKDANSPWPINSPLRPTADELSQLAQSKFAESIFADQQWRQRNSYIQLKSSVVPYGNALRWAVFNRKHLRESYARFIDRFARCSEDQLNVCPPLQTSPLLMDYRDAIERGKVPFFQYNFTIATQSKKQWDGLVRASPFRFGNEAFGYHRWVEKDDMPLRKTVGISGAATPIILPYQLPDYFHGRPSPADGITAYDGAGADLKGEGEKLGALSLLERGIKNIIILDTELDPDYDFGAYRILKKLASERGIRLSIPDIDKFIPPKAPVWTWLFSYRNPAVVPLPPVMTGQAESIDPIRTGWSGTLQIRYVKMSLSDKLFSYKRTRFWGERFCAAGADFEALGARNAVDRPVSTVLKRRVLERRRIPDLGQGGLTPGHYAAAIVDYANYLERIYSAGAMGRPHKDESKFTSYQFPMISTVDQKFSPDLAEALIGLGYLQALHVRLGEDTPGPVASADPAMKCRSSGVFLPAAIRE